MSMPENTETSHHDDTMIDSDRSPREMIESVLTNPETDGSKEVFLGDIRYGVTGYFNGNVQPGNEELVREFTGVAKVLDGALDGALSSGGASYLEIADMLGSPRDALTLMMVGQVLGVFRTIGPFEILQERMSKNIGITFGRGGEHTEIPFDFEEHPAFYAHQGYLYSAFKASDSSQES